VLTGIIIIFTETIDYLKDYLFFMIWK